MRALLSFFTAFPLRGASLDEAARRAYLLPLVGLLTGVPGALLLLLGYAMPSGVVATLALGAVLLAAGLHHADGVLDVGDALMVRGGPGRRREALKDTRVGIGGLGALFFVYAPTLAALAALTEASPIRAAIALLAAEVAARSAMLLVLAFGKPAEPGSSSVPFVRSLRGRRGIAGTALALAAPVALLLPLGGAAPAAPLAAPLVSLAALRVSRRAFGGIGGDVSGTTGEAARAVLLVILSATV
ncbi:MAG TPA: adenosylcobinamide-GDP ribazoletransferase [Rubrobacteraceae bacterium]|nr:adenosylcobinamide-GDP ribazoletransferase [Rubrobacteraceae bacterium]